jgi:hypothetical protein
MTSVPLPTDVRPGPSRSEATLSETHAGNGRTCRSLTARGGGFFVIESKLVPNGALGRVLVRTDRLAEPKNGLLRVVGVQRPACPDDAVHQPLEVVLAPVSPVVGHHVPPVRGRPDAPASCPRPVGRRRRTRCRFHSGRCRRRTTRPSGGLRPKRETGGAASGLSCTRSHPGTGEGTRWRPPGTGRASSTTGPPAQTRRGSPGGTALRLSRKPWRPRRDTVPARIAIGRAGETGVAGMIA